MSEDVAELLAEWRAAQRRFESLVDADTSCPRAAADVARSWLAYQLAVGALDPDEVVLIVDDERRYVAVSPNAEQLLGIAPERLLTMRIDDVSSADQLPALEETWQHFLGHAASAGKYSWSGGETEVPVEFRARANWPVRHVHVSQLKVTSVSKSPDGAADGAWKTVAQSHATIDRGRDLIRSVRGPAPQSIDSADAPRISAPAEDARQAS